MAATLSDDEFQRLQTQLLELRSTNYNLDETCKRQQQELFTVKHHLEEHRKELSKLNQTLSRSKKAKEIEKLLSDNGILQRKLQSQEDEFRLQNETLIQELSAVVTQNENLMKKIEELEGTSTRRRSSESAAGDARQEELWRLQAENSALQKSISELRGDKEHGGRIPALDHPLRVDGEDGLSESISPLDARIQLNIEIEEKTMLKNQMQQMEAKYKEQLVSVEEQNEKLVERLKRKHESFLQIQQEKDSMYAENKRAFEAMQVTKDQEIQQLKELCQRLQTQLNNVQLAQQDLKQSSSVTIERLQDTVTELQTKLNSASTEMMQQVIAEKASLETALAEALQRHERAETELSSALKMNEEMGARIILLQNTIEGLEDASRSSAMAASEANKVAEKRRQLVEEIGAHLLEEETKHREAVQKLTDEYNTTTQALQAQLEAEKTKTVRLKEAEAAVENYRAAMLSLREEVTNLRDNALQHMRDMQADIDRYKSETEECMSTFQQDGAKLKAAMEEKVKDLTIQLEICNSQKCEFEEEVKKLKQEIKDSIEDRKIQDKKGLSMVKELKRQLQTERRRADRLQERLQELLNEPGLGRSEELFQPVNYEERQRGDSSSIGSWSYVSGNNENSKDSSKDSTNNNSNGHSSGAEQTTRKPSPGLLEQENNDLLGRLAALQEEKWVLEEKINHLEVSNSAMAEDLVSKTAIIQYYCMDHKYESGSTQHMPMPDKPAVKRLVDFLKDKGDDNLKEINRRMQGMLEETLIKNMHLQKDMEILSKELHQIQQVKNPEVIAAKT
ncbi:GRIP1-associated protein 1-like isoform X2 [Ornithodoros turicata]|uniref:GRIP1-associated protein 1-like isoform X2 n=1 Tax=Ornithodoros turicata TaxID=34597 RepID=UPI00313A12EB